MSDFGDLRARCRDWSVGTGDAYLASSKLRMNMRSGDTLSCTAHDIGVFDYFGDWMDSRALQAEALARDIRDMQTVDSGTAISGQDLDGLGRNFGERAVMALYGVDLDMQRELLSQYGERRGTPAYPDISDEIGRRVQARDFAYLEELAGRLDAFKSGWDSVKSAEAAGYDYTRKNHVGPVCSVSTMYGWTEGDTMRFFSTEMLNRYIAEVNGRRCVRNELSGRHPDGQDPDIWITGAPDRDQERVRQYGKNRPALDMILDVTNWPVAGGQCPYDGAAIVETVERDVEERMRTAQVTAGVGRDTSDLDAACDDIERARPDDYEMELK